MLKQYAVEVEVVFREDMEFRIQDFESPTS